MDWKDTMNCTSQIVYGFVLRDGLFVNCVLVQGNLNGFVLKAIAFHTILPPLACQFWSYWFYERQLLPGCYWEVCSRFFACVISLMSVWLQVEYMWCLCGCAYAIIGVLMTLFAFCFLVLGGASFSGLLCWLLVWSYLMSKLLCLYVRNFPSVFQMY